MDYHSLNQISEIFNGVRITRYIDENNKNTNQKVFASKIIKNSEERLQTENISIKSKIDKKFYSKENDILLQTIGSANTTQIINETGIIIPMNYIILRVHENYNPIFIYYLLKSVRFANILEKVRGGSNSQFIRIPDLKQIKLKIPDLKTQNKYAKIMKLLDEKNKLERKKLKINNQIQNAIIIGKLGDKYVKF